MGEQLCQKLHCHDIAHLDLIIKGQYNLYPFPSAEVFFCEVHADEVTPDTCKTIQARAEHHAWSGYYYSTYLGLCFLMARYILTYLCTVTAFSARYLIFLLTAQKKSACYRDSRPHSHFYSLTNNIILLFENTQNWHLVLNNKSNPTGMVGPPLAGAGPTEELTFLNADGTIDDLLPSLAGKPPLDAGNHRIEILWVTSHQLVKFCKLQRKVTFILFARSKNYARAR